MKRIYWKIGIISIIVLMCGFLFISYIVQQDIQKYYFDNRQDTPKVSGESSSSCQTAGGQWSEEFRECLGIDATTCQKIGGVFNECASACRNDPKAEICTMQCVQVCKIK